MLEKGEMFYKNIFNFENLLVWNRIVGKKLKVRLLESDFLAYGNLIDDFATLIGVGAFRKPDRVRESFAAEYIEYIRLMNGKEALSENFRKRVYEILSFASTGKKKLALSDLHAQMIQEHYRELVERITENFFPGRPYLFTPKFRGCGVMPAPMTDHRKSEIETIIRKKWNSRIPGKVVLARKLAPVWKPS